MTLTGQKYVDLKSFDVKKYSKSNQQKSALLVPSGISFTPTTASAGTQTVLTITGTDFGATQGSVWFSNADDGGGTFIRALDTQVLTWGDTEITVEIPSGAGTGSVRVEDASNAANVSSSTLTITYAELNAVFDIDDETGSGGSNGPLTPFAYPVRHVGTNGSGGYTWTMETNFDANAGAKDAFETALDKWRCETDVNWTVSNSTTSIDIAAGGDGVNVVTFDDQTTPSKDLPDDVLGRCTSYISGCGIIGNPTSWNAHVAELDIVFDDEVSWYYGSGLPGFTEFDFESVALHELGHGHQLGHVIDPFTGTNLDDVMHWSIGNSQQQRVLSAGNITAATNVHSRSTTVDECSQPLMTDYAGSCTLGVEQNELEAGISIYPNPAKEALFIKNTSYITLKTAVVFDVNGRNIIEHDISERSNFKTINLSGISSGIYFIKIASDEASITRKLVIE